jgi:DNA polymerase IV
VLKLKTKEFNSLTRSVTPPSVPITSEDFTNLGLHLCSRVDLDARQFYRLVGIGLSNFEVEGDVEPEAAPLIESLGT